MPPPQPADRVVLLHRGTDGFDVGPERDEAASRVPVAVVVVNLTGVALGQKGRSEDVSDFKKESFSLAEFQPVIYGGVKTKTSYTAQWSMVLCVVFHFIRGQLCLLKEVSPNHYNHL